MTRQTERPCSFEQCDRLGWSKGLCRGHYAQQRRGRDLSPILPPVASRAGVRDEHGRKHCQRCGCWAPEEEFCRNANAVDGLGSICRTCRQLYDMKRNYGLAPHEHDMLLAAQGNRCMVCRRDVGHVGRNGWNVDHDHECCPGVRTCGKCIRGLLCGFCNRGLGLFQDSPGLLRAAADYLDRSAENINAVEKILKSEFRNIGGDAI